MPPTVHDVTRALRIKGSKLLIAAGELKTAGRDADAALAKQEGEDCNNRADVLDTGVAFQFPSDAVLAQLAADCDALQTAIQNSADVTALVNAAAKVRASMPANSVV